MLCIDKFYIYNNNKRCKFLMDANKFKFTFIKKKKNIKCIKLKVEEYIIANRINKIFFLETLYDHCFICQKSFIHYIKNFIYLKKFIYHILSFKLNSELIDIIYNNYINRLVSNFDNIFIAELKLKNNYYCTYNIHMCNCCYYRMFYKWLKKYDYYPELRRDFEHFIRIDKHIININFDNILKFKKTKFVNNKKFCKLTKIFDLNNDYSKYYS